MMNTKALSLLAAVSLALGSAGFAADAKSDYQVTGPVLDVTDSMIVVQKGKEKWEIARNSSTKMTGEVKKGDKVTIQYGMTATSVEVKADKAAAKKDDKTAAKKK
jgi:RNase P/RNase MRP subunit p29